MSDFLNTVTPEDAVASFMEQYDRKVPNRSNEVYLYEFFPKRNVSSRLVNSKNELESDKTTFMHSIKNRIKTVVKLFEHPDVTYIN